MLFRFIIEFPHNARYGWLKQRTEQGLMTLKCLPRNFDKFDQYTSAVTHTNAM